MGPIDQVLGNLSDLLAHYFSTLAFFQGLEHSKLIPTSGLLYQLFHSLGELLSVL